MPSSRVPDGDTTDDLCEFLPINTTYDIEAWDCHIIRRLFPLIPKKLSHYSITALSDVIFSFCMHLLHTCIIHTQASHWLVSVSTADKGASIYYVRKTVVFLDPLPLVTHRNQLILFLLSAFWGPLSPTHCGRHVWKPPITKRRRLPS